MDRPHLSSSKKRIVEFLGERDLAFVIDDQLQFYRVSLTYRLIAVGNVA